MELFDNEDILFIELCKKTFELILKLNLTKKELYQKFADLGFIPLLARNTNIKDSLLVIYSAAQVSSGLAHALATINYGYYYPIYYYGTENVKNKYLRPLESGKVGLLAVNEPDGIGENRILTIAKEHKKNCYILNGCKTLITEAEHGDFALVYAMIQSQGRKGNGIILVDLKKEGVNIQKKEICSGMKFLDVAEIFFENVQIERDDIVLECNQGGMGIGKAMELMRCSCSVICMAIAEQMINKLFTFLMAKKSNSNSSCLLPESQTMISDIILKFHNIKIIVYMMLLRVDAFEEERLELASITKVLCVDFLQDIAEKVYCLFGGNAYTVKHEIAELYLDAKAFYFLGGSKESIKEYIAYEGGIKCL